MCVLPKYFNGILFKMEFFKTKRFLVVGLFISIGIFECFSQIDSTSTELRSLPLAKKWFVERNIDLPLPFGVSTFFTYMSRDVDIKDVKVSLQDVPKQSVDDFISFELNNKTTVAALKADMWILPFLNVYGLLGYVSTNAALDATITYDRILIPGPPIIIPINVNSKLQGSYYGIGSSLVAGVNNWFVLGDINYGYSKLSELDGKIDFWMYSTRTGFQSRLSRNIKVRTWIGGMYLSSKRTLNLSIMDDAIGMVEVEVFQETLKPWTFQLGTSFNIGKHIEVLYEVGTNFDDAGIGVMSCTYRF